jgi:hypothetical protein
MESAIDATIEKLKQWYVESAPKLSENGRKFCSQQTFRRYAVARNGDYEAAVQNLVETLEWRETNVPELLQCPICNADPLMHCFFPIGLDENKRLVIYSCASRAKTNERDITVRHMVHTLEHAWRFSDELGLDHQWVWIIDFNGFGMKNALEFSTSRATLSAFSKHMPERLGAVLLINPPSVFGTLLRAIKQFADARTMSKVRAQRHRAYRFVAPAMRLCFFCVEHQP